MVLSGHVNGSLNLFRASGDMEHIQSWRSFMLVGGQRLTDSAPVTGWRDGS